jgi:ribosomal protein S18 acetylase RimI-like enzyme
MIAYRSGGPADIHAIDSLFRRSFADTFAHLYDPADLAAFFARFTEAAWREELVDPDYAFRLAEEDGMLAGFAKVSSTTVPGRAEPAAELRQLYVLERWQGTGVARTLIEWAFEEGRRRGAAALYLTVFTDNHRAKRFYERYGFKPVGHHAFMVGNQADDDIVMRAGL